VYITVDPTWPWNISWYGLPALAGVALLLIALTVWTYVGLQKITWRRMISILLLRLAALIVACLLVLRPSLARQDDDVILPSRLLILVDSSDSMNLKDEFNNTSRWDNARRILASDEVVKVLNNLAVNEKIEIVYYQGAEGIARFEPEGKATGKRTDVGGWLHDLWQKHGRETNLRGLLIFSDGADNGTRYVALKQAARWAGVCPVHTFRLGSQKTTLNLRDIALVDIQPPTQPVPIKTQFTVTGRISAPGFENSTVDVSLWIEDDPSTGTMKQAGRKEPYTLRKTHDNEVSLTRDVPKKAGEYKITLKVDPRPGEVTETNNQISSYITATKEGVSILWVEGRKRLESAFVLRFALERDPRFRLYPAEKLGPLPPEQQDWFNFDKQHYDVIVIGDISAQRFSDGNREVFRKIRDSVEKEGTGLLMLAGHDTFANKDWNGFLAKDLASLLPVELDTPGHVEGPTNPGDAEKYRMKPTRAGYSYFLLNLSDDADKNKKIWEKTLGPLDGLTHLGTVKAKSTVLATGFGDEPVLVGTQHGEGEGRVLVFGADTTWKTWRRSPEMLPAYERFWKQTMLWLAHQEKAAGSAWIKLDTRRLTAGVDQRLGFDVGLRGKGGLNLKKAQIKAQVIGPGKVKTEVPIVFEDVGQRGYFFKTAAPGEYRVQVQANGTDVDGTDLKDEASARFLVVDEDLETLAPAANHDFLEKLAHAGGGQSFPADERPLARFLAKLTALKEGRPRVERWPDWTRNPPAPVSGQSPSIVDQLAVLWDSAALPCLLLFVSFIAIEWYLRRRWGLV